MFGLCIIIVILFYLVFMAKNDLDFQKNKDKCFNCGRWIDQNYMYCPYCNEQIKKICNECGREIEINWRNCPFCGYTEKLGNLK